MLGVYMQPAGVPDLPRPVDGWYCFPYFWHYEIDTLREKGADQTVIYGTYYISRFEVFNPLEIFSR